MPLSIGKCSNLFRQTHEPLATLLERQALLFCSLESSGRLVRLKSYDLHGSIDHNSTVYQQ